MKLLVFQYFVFVEILFLQQSKVASVQMFPFNKKLFILDQVEEKPILLLGKYAGQQIRRNFILFTP